MAAHRITRSTLRGLAQKFNEAANREAEVLTRLYGPGTLDIRMAGDTWSVVRRNEAGDATNNVTHLYTGTLRECASYLQGRLDGLGFVGQMDWPCTCMHQKSTHYFGDRLDANGLMHTSCQSGDGCDRFVPVSFAGKLA